MTNFTRSHNQILCNLYEKPVCPNCSIMEKTGIGLYEILSLVTILLPLIPLFIIFISKSYRQDSISLLMIFCMVSFIQNVILYVPGLVTINQAFIKIVFALAQFVLLLLIIRLTMDSKFIREGIKIVLISFVTVVITLFTLNRVQDYGLNIEIGECIILVCLTLLALFHIIKNQDMFIFYSPLFWIAGGTLFYYTMYLLTQSLPEKNTHPATPNEQKRMLLLIIIFVQFIFYTIAAAVAGKSGGNDRINYQS